MPLLTDRIMCLGINRNNKYGKFRFIAYLTCLELPLTNSVSTKVGIKKEITQSLWIILPNGVLLGWYLNGDLEVT